MRGIADIPDNVATSAKMWDNAMGPRMSNIKFPNANKYECLLV